ncbi:MAG: AmmeMemoRadiSam system radical SAM enzyme [Planctomycetota bacterium]
MDQEANQDVTFPDDGDCRAHAGPVLSRRSLLKYGAYGLVGLSAAGGAVLYSRSLTRAAEGAAVFENDAPRGRLWEQWKARGWVREAKHYRKLGSNVQCRLCPNDCLLEPEDRGRCRNRVNKDGTLYTLAYGNPCAYHPDPIEKKPLFHFLPQTDVVSIATSGCGFRCKNCQNWDISQRKPEETKDPRGEPTRLNPEALGFTSPREAYYLTVSPPDSMFPADVVALAQYAGTPSIAYTYSEPTVWFEYMFDTATLARAKGLRNVWVTCGYIQEESLADLCGVLDAANVDLKGFREDVYEELNSGKLEPILNTLKTLKREGVWFEVTNLVVPTYTDDRSMIRRMCDWLVDNLGPDYPLHFSRFHPQHKLAHLEPTPVQVLEEAQAIARDCGLRYVYLGNVRGVEGAETTFCPTCREAVIERDVYSVNVVGLKDGKCASCDTELAGVWV